jgi:tRNA nucleotidyltransferase (CCA-adding enzyme)
MPPGFLKFSQKFSNFPGVASGLMGLQSVSFSLPPASALSPQTWPFDLALLPPQAYLVGGSVRDALLQRQADYLDLDFVVPTGAVETARAIATACNAGFVVLDMKHQIARVVFEQATVDFAQQVGPTLESDLRRRDFTINAIAYHPQSQTLVDPLQGSLDLEQKQLRMISASNLREDPLRLLRAYRQAAQLDFTVTPQTQTAICQLAPLLAQVAAERVRGELDALLSRPQGTARLTQAWQDGLLTPWLPVCSLTRLRRLAAIDQVMAQLAVQWPAYARSLTGWFKEQGGIGLHRSWVKAAKLSQMVAANPAEAETTLEGLKYSRAEQQAIIAVVRALPQLEKLVNLGTPSRRQQYELFRAAGPSFGAVALVGLGLGWPEAAIAPLIHRYLAPKDPVAHPTPLLSGRDVMTALGLRPGPKVGQLLSAVELAHAEGKVETAAEALAWIQRPQASWLIPPEED